jgi:hypothetical protein
MCESARQMADKARCLGRVLTFDFEGTPRHGALPLFAA